MNITQFKVKPSLVEIVIDDKEIVESYGETITFYMYDHLDIKTYFDFFEAQSKNDTDRLVDIIKTIIKDKDGNNVLDDKHQLPIDIFASAVMRIGEHLGKSKTKNSTSVETGTQP